MYLLYSCRYSDMITAAVVALKERGGSSRQAVLKYICSTYEVDKKKAAVQTRLSLKKMVVAGELKMAKEKGKGAGCYKLADKSDMAAPAAKKPKKAAAKKTKSATKKTAKEKAKPKVVVNLKPAAKKSATKRSAAKKTSGKKAAKKGNK